MNRIMIAGAAALLAAAPTATPPAAAAAADAPLRVIPVDVEGGAATLLVTPQGHSLLIDTGWPAGLGGPRPAPGEAPPPPTPSSAERIVAAARAAGLSRLDYVLITHYHVDHVGGVAELARLIPIGTFLDHGPNRETPPPNAPPAALQYATATLYPQYEAVIAGRPHRVMRPGDTLKIDALTITAVNSDRAVLARPLAGAGEPGTGCANAQDEEHNGGEENPRSLGILASWGKARLVALGDTTWSVENKLVCPVDRIGPVDLMIADNHGSGNSSSQAILDTLRPTIVLVANGPTKGADAPTFDRVMASPRIKAVWQLHFATRSPDKNAPADQIANPDAAADARYPLQISVAKSGAITVLNPRTGRSTSYPAAARGS